MEQSENSRKIESSLHRWSINENTFHDGPDHREPFKSGKSSRSTSRESRQKDQSNIRATELERLHRQEYSVRKSVGLVEETKMSETYLGR